jgi:hypothetical protein
LLQELAIRRENLIEHISFSAIRLQSKTQGWALAPKWLSIWQRLRTRLLGGPVPNWQPRAEAPPPSQMLYSMYHIVLNTLSEFGFSAFGLA